MISNLQTDAFHSERHMHYRNLQKLVEPREGLPRSLSHVLEVEVGPAHPRAMQQQTDHLVLHHQD